MSKFYEYFKFSIESVTPFPAPPNHLFGSFAAANAAFLTLAKALDEVRKSGGGLPVTFGAICQVARLAGNSAWLLVKSSGAMTASGHALHTHMIVRAGSTLAACGAAWYIGALSGAIVYAATAETSVMQSIEKGITEDTAPFWAWWYGTDKRDAETAKMEAELARRGELNYIKKYNERLIYKRF